MATKVNHTVLAYLLALQDFSNSLSEPEKANLKTIAKELKLQPKAWESYIKPRLLAMIEGNSQLNQSFQFYKNKLDQLGEIPLALLNQTGEVNQFMTDQSPLASRGFIDDTPASGYEQQLNNVVIVVNQTDNPEETVKQLSFLGKVKQYLSQESQ